MIEAAKKQNLDKAVRYLKRNGIKNTFYQSLERIAEQGKEQASDPVCTQETLQKQREQTFLHPYRISILVPAYETDPAHLLALIRSVAEQSYENWELCIADGSETDTVKNTVMEASGTLDSSDAKKIRYRKLEKNLGISGNTNEALSMATGEYVGFLDHDDLLSPDALYEVMQVLTENLCKDGNVYSNRIRALYTDEDKTDESGTRFFEPHRKPGFDIDLLRSNNYICHFFVVRTEIARNVGGLSSEFDGAQDHDFIFRCLENVPVSAVVHIGKILYHWRCHAASTAENPDSKTYAYEAGKRAVEAHLRRKGIAATVVDTPHLGFFRVIYEQIPSTIRHLTRKQWDELTEEAFEKIGEDYLMILAEDLKPLTHDYLTELSGHLARYEVGCVGGKVYDKHFRVESAGYTRDPDGKMVPNFHGLNGHFSGYMHRACLQQRVDGLTLDCMMIRKSAVAFSKNGPVLANNYVVVFDPYAEFKRK